MLYVTNGQFGVFLAFVWLGAMLKVFYDLFCIKGKFKTLFDAVYFLLGGILFICFMQEFNLGNFRFFLLLGLLLGILLEHIFVSKMLAQANNLLYTYMNAKVKSLILKTKQNKSANLNQQNRQKIRKQKIKNKNNSKKYKKIKN